MRLATNLIILIGCASLCIAPMAFAQSDDGSPPTVSESDGIPEPPAPVAGDLLVNSATGGSSATADDSSGPPASHTDWIQVPETNSDTTTSGEDGQLVEIPQAANPDQAADPNGNYNNPAEAPNEAQDYELWNDELGYYNSYDPYTIGYDPYGAWWYPVPIYYYSRGHGYHYCGDGNCGGRVGDRGGHHMPPLGTGTRTRPPGTASHPMTVARIPHLSIPTVASAPSGGFGSNGGFDRGGGFGRTGFGNGGGFGGGHGFGGSGFGGAHGGFGR